MMRSFIASLVLALVSLACPLAVNAAGITAAYRRDDPRLGKQVKLRSTRVYVGDLLADLSKQTEIEIRPGDLRDGVADEQVMVSITESSVGDVMDALWSLMSYQSGEWYWERRKSGDQFSYALLRPLRARQLTNRLEAAAQQVFEQNAQELLTAARMSPEERERLAEKDEQVRLLLSSDRLWSGLRTFSETLTPEVQLQVLRGQAEPKIKTSDLPPQGQAFVRSLWEKAGRRGIFGARVENPEAGPGWIKFSAPLLNSARGTRSLLIYVEGLGGYGYLGGAPLDRAWKQKLSDGWCLPGDEREDTRENRMVPLPMGGALPQNNEPQKHIIEKRLFELAEAMPLSLIASVPNEQKTDPGSPVGKQLREYLERISQGVPELDHKWRGKILLLKSPTWYRVDAQNAKVPWKVVKRLREACAVRDGVPSPEDLVTVADDLSSAQILTLANDYPVMAFVSHWRELFALGNRNAKLWRQIRSDAGGPVTQVFPAVTGYSRQILEQIAKEYPGARLRVFESSIEYRRKQVPGITVSIDNLDGKNILGQRSLIVFPSTSDSDANRQQ